MKITIKFLFFSVCLITACSSQNKYFVEGVVEHAQDGDYVFLQDYDGYQIKDSACVTNGTFNFSGVADSLSRVFRLFYKKENRFYIANLFLEKGNIQVVLNDSSKVGGTVSNDLYQDYQHDMAIHTKKIQSLYPMMMDTTLSLEAKNAVRDSVKQIHSQRTQKTIASVRTHLNTHFGVYLLLNNYMSYPAETIDSLLHQLKDHFIEEPKVDAMKKHIEVLLATSEGHQFVDFSMKDIHGNEITLSDIVSENKLTILDFWASWCGPCRYEIPYLKKTYEAFHSKGLQLVSVSLDHDEQKWKNAVEEHDMPWIHLSDLQGWQCKANALYGVRSVPFTLLIGQDGIIIAKRLRGDALYDACFKYFNE